jgi:hypothetical protein
MQLSSLGRFSPSVGVVVLAAALGADDSGDQPRPPLERGEVPGHLPRYGGTDYVLL